MGGTTNALARWAREPQFYRDRVFRGHVLEIGPGYDPLACFAAALPGLTAHTTVDHNPVEAPTTAPRDALAGDATLLAIVGDRTFDLVYSSHVLEHVVNPTLTLARWWEKVRPGGFLAVMVPSWVHYERRLWPPHRNTDHKTAWVLVAPDHPLPFIRGLVTEVAALPGGTILRAMTLDAGWNPMDTEDQTANGTCECGLEVVVQKQEAAA